MNASLKAIRVKRKEMASFSVNRGPWKSKRTNGLTVSMAILWSDGELRPGPDNKGVAASML